MANLLKRIFDGEGRDGKLVVGGVVVGIELIVDTPVVIHGIGCSGGAKEACGGQGAPEEG